MKPRHPVQVLRKILNCTLPIELVYNGEYEMDAKTCNRFEVCMAQFGSDMSISILVLICLSFALPSPQSRILLLCRWLSVVLPSLGGVEELHADENYLSAPNNSFFSLYKSGPFIFHRQILFLTLKKVVLHESQGAVSCSVQADFQTRDAWPQASQTGAPHTRGAF